MPRAVAHVDAVEILGQQARASLELGDDLVFLAVELDAAEVEAAEENLQRARDVLDAHSQGGGAAAIDVETKLGLRHLEAAARVHEVGHRAKLVEQALRIGVELLEILSLNHELERGAESAADRFRDVRHRDGALDVLEKLLPQPTRPVDDLLNAALAVFLLLEPDEDDALIRLTWSGHREGGDGAVGRHFRNVLQDCLHLAHLFVGVFGRGTFRREHEAEQTSLVFLGQEFAFEILEEPDVRPADDHREKGGDDQSHSQSRNE